MRRSFLVRLAKRSLREFRDDHCPQLAAAIAYHVLFSLFPLLIVLGGVFGIVVNVTGVQADVVDMVVRNAPLSEEGESDLRRLLEGATGGLSALGLLAVPALLWSASGMMSAIRLALALAWDLEERRPFLRGKLVDVGLVLATAAFVVLSLVLTVAARLVERASETVRDALGPFGLTASGAAWLFGVLVPLALAFAVVLFVYRVVPARTPRFADIWPAALVVAGVFVAAQNLFALYLEHFGRYNAIYGSIGAIVAFLFFVYLASNVFLLGAEIAAELGRLREERRP